MHFEPRPTSVLAAVLYAAAAIFSGVSLGLVVSSALRLDDAIRNAVLSDMRSLLLVWGLVCCFGVVFAVLALRFARLSVSGQRVMLVMSCGIAIVAGVGLEWWQALYFLLPPIVLVLAFPGAVHA